MNEAFQRPASYWLHRAEKVKQQGDVIRAAVLQRHALRAEPQSDAAAMAYALTLRQLGCYEASIREAFRALAQNPHRTPLFGIVAEHISISLLPCYLLAILLLMFLMHSSMLKICGIKA